MNNQRDGLTGLLIVGGRRFLQALEGPQQVLNRAYRRIRADNRHFALVQLSRRSVAKRSFADWDMAYQLGDPAEDGIGLPRIVEALTAQLADPALQAELRTFATIHSRAV